MIDSFKILEQKTQDAAVLLCRDVYGYSHNIFDGSYTVVESSAQGIAEIPLVKRKGRYASLELSVEGSEFWSNVLGAGCEAANIDPSSVYASSGLALLELANVVVYSSRENDPVVRLRKVEKSFNDDLTAQNVGSLLSERTRIDLTSVVQGLDDDDYLKISKLRYGIGVALKVYDLSDEKKSDFSTANINDAIIGINNYKEAVVKFLNNVIFEEGSVHIADTSSREVTTGVYRADFPFVQVAAAIPMNVEMLLNK